MLQPVISIQGEAGSYHHEAALHVFPNAKFLYRDRFRKVFEDGQSGKADFLLVAIENSLAGSLMFNYDLLAEFQIPIIGETYMAIHHQLIGLPDTKIEDITEVWSHPMALAQCATFLDHHHLEMVEQADTAGSVRALAIQNRPDLAAIAGRTAAEIHGMNILAANIETDPENYTRFLILSNKYKTTPVKPGEPMKTSLYCRLEDKPGALMSLLKPITEAKVNLSMIESRPRPGKPWKYDFYLDVLIDAFSTEGELLIDNLANQSKSLILLGSYPNLDSQIDFK